MLPRIISIFGKFSKRVQVIPFPGDKQSLKKASNLLLKKVAYSRFSYDILGQGGVWFYLAAQM